MKNAAQLKSGLVATALVFAAASTMALQGCASDGSSRGNRMGFRAQGNGNGLGLGGGACCAECAVGAMSTEPVVDLSFEARLGLLKMRQEEKLARDVYAALGEQWGANVFAITNAEQRHMDAMGMMLDRFGMADPITDDGPGEFADQAFTDLYNTLVESGSGSLLDALKVGAKIEELDLVDLRVALDGVNDPVLTKVYGNLMRATRNHLRAFAAQIDANGGTYDAEFLSQEEFDTIASSEFERGGPAGRGRGGRGMRGGNGTGQGMGMRFNTTTN